MMTRYPFLGLGALAVLVTCGGDAEVQSGSGGSGGSGGVTATTTSSGGASTGGSTSTSGTGGSFNCEGCTPPILCGAPSDPCSCGCSEGEKWILGSVVYTCTGGCLAPGEDLCAAPCNADADCAAGFCATDGVVGCKRCWAACDGLDCPTENTCVSDSVCGAPGEGFCVCDAYGCTLCMIQ